MVRLGACGMCFWVDRELGGSGRGVVLWPPFLRAWKVGYRRYGWDVSHLWWLVVVDFLVAPALKAVAQQALGCCSTGRGLVWDNFAISTHSSFPYTLQILRETQVWQYTHECTLLMLRMIVMPSQHFTS